MSYSSLFNGMSFNPNPMEKYDPEKFRVLKVGTDAVPSKKPDELSSTYLAEEAIKAHIRNSGSYSLSPFSFNWNQASQIYTIISIFKKLSNTVNLSSCRIDAIAHDPGLAQLIKFFGSTNLPTAVEGISERIRNFLQKSITPDQLYVGLNYILETDFQEIKIYMIYTGLENERDFEEWETLLKYLQELKRKFNRPNLPVRVSFTPLFSTLGTPTQYHGSRVSKSMKMAVPPIFNIKRIANKYDIAIRLSASVDSSDLGQLFEFLDRRGQPLIEYGGICGFSYAPKAHIILHKGAKEVTKQEFLDHPEAGQKWEDNKKFYIASEYARKFTINQMYSNMMENNLYAEMSVPEFSKFLLNLNGKDIPQQVLSWLIPSTRALLEGGQMTVIPMESEDYLRTTSRGQKQYAMLLNMSVSNLQTAHAKELTPLFTNGMTFEDIISDKSGLHIFPSDHVDVHENRPPGWNFQSYVKDYTGVFINYCISGVMSTCVQCLDMDNALFDVIVEDEGTAPQIEDNRPHLNNY